MAEGRLWTQAGAPPGQRDSGFSMKRCRKWSPGASLRSPLGVWLRASVVKLCLGKFSNFKNIVLNNNIYLFHFNENGCREVWGVLALQCSLGSSKTSRRMRQDLRLEGCA